MSENEVKDLEQEPKTELDDSQKSSLAKRGFGGILVGAAIILIFLLFNPFTDEPKEEQKKQAAQVFVEPKSFIPQNEQQTPLFQSNADVNNVPDNIPFDENYNNKQVVKGLSSAAVPTQGSIASQQQTSGDMPLEAQAAAQRAAELRQMAQTAQKQLDSLVAAGTSTGEVSYDNVAIGNTGVTVTAKKSTLDPNLSLNKGTFIPCVLRTAIISSIAGNIACTITNDIYSAAGTVILIEKGSVVQGFFRSGTIEPGMNRLFVIWEEIQTPKQIVINVNAPATDALGGSGIAGWVDNHYLQRFGAAILLSMIDDAFSAAFDNKDGRDYTMNTRENTMDMANTVLENTINIKPTLYKNHGDIVGIYVNKDVDFSKVYRLTKVENRIPK